ncbi:cellulase family glycosylhydrolase [Paenibacillus rhizoplanae]
MNPHWLIIVEGIEQNVQGNTSKYWWGGNLTGVRNYPVTLTVPNQVVYSPHDYGPGVAEQPWFSDPAFSGESACYMGSDLGLYQQREHRSSNHG